jgi:hypothetical protein
MDQAKFKGKDAFDPTFYPMSSETVDFMWGHIIPAVWQTIIQNEEKPFP